MIVLILVPVIVVVVLGLFFYFNRDPHKDLPTFSVEDLEKYSGSSGPIYIGAGSLVFDVSSCEAYRPGNNYSVFAGKDATVALARMSLDSKDMNIESTLTAQEQKTLQEWLDFYQHKKNYPIVGRLLKKPKSS